MEIKSKQGSLSEIECDVIIVNLFEGVEIPAGATGAVDKALGNIISTYVIDKDKFKGKLGTTYILPTYGKIPAKKVLLVGLGQSEEFNTNKIREVASKAIRKAITTLKPKTVCSILHGAGVAGLNPNDCAQMVVEGTLLGAYKFSKYKSPDENEQQDENANANNYSEIERFEIVEIDSSKMASINKGIEKGRIIAESTNFARDMVNEPACYLTPTKLAEIACSINNIDCKILEKEAVEKLGMGAYLAVSKGSTQPPKFIHMTYKSHGTPKKRIALIGKGVTFDSGGLNLKPGNSMAAMKDDMAGAAAVLGVMKAIKVLKPEIEVHGIIAACENMLGGNSYRPGDVLKAMNGKTIEVDNTDAEGRLTLADALCYAVDLKVDEIIDIATLTGACVVALGGMASGIMGNDQKLIDALIKAGEKGGERLWQLPMYKEYFESMKSDIADFKNAGGREAGASSAALFLKEFVTDIAWAHIDIAGPAWLDKGIKELSKGASGAAVRTLVQYLTNTH